jgi:hypothetical protein
MGDIYSRPENDYAMARVLSPPPGLLAATLDGVGLVVDGDYVASRTNPAGFLERTDAILRDLVRHRSDLPRCVDPEDAEAVVFQRIRWRRRAMLRIALRQAGRHSVPTVRSLLDTFNHLAWRAGRHTLEPELFDDLTAFHRRLVSDPQPNDPSVRSLLAALVDHLREDISAYHIRFDALYRPVPTPPPTPPPSAPAVVASRSSLPAVAFPFRTPIDAPVDGGDDADGDADAALCVVCIDEPRTPRLPCGHKTMCGTCAASVDRCPLCRDPFDPSEVAWTDACAREFYRPPPTGLT